MDTFQLKEFITLSRTLSYSETAFMLDVSTSALSRHIQLLEDELGGRLFERTTRSISLTPFGEMYLAHAHRIFDAFELSMRDAEEFHVRERNTFTFGAIHTMEEYNISRYLIWFRREYPDIYQDLIVDTISSLERKFSEGSINVYTAVRNPDVPGLQFTKFGESKIRAIVREDSPFADAEKVPLEAIADYPLILQPRDTIFYNRVMEYYGSEGIRPNVIVTGEYSECIPFVLEGMGIALQPFESTRSVSREGIRVISTDPEITYEYGLGFRNRLSEAERAFVDFVGQFAPVHTNLK